MSARLGQTLADLQQVIAELQRSAQGHARQQSESLETVTPVQQEVDAVIVGAGFAGLYMLHRLRGLGLVGARVRGRRAASAAPGTGTAIPAPAATSRAWSTPTRSPTSCSRNGTGRERYAAQPEILRYANHVADRFDLRRDIQFDTRVTDGAFRRGDASLGRSATDRGDARVGAVLHHGDRLPLDRARCRMFPGLETFEGKPYHTGPWPHEGVDFTGQRVGVIGTGSSAIQAIPVIAEQAAHLYVFQRTPNLQHPGAQRSARPGGRAARGRRTIAERRRAAREIAHRHRREQSERQVRAGGVATRSGERELRGALGSAAGSASWRRSTICSSTRQANDTAADSSATRSARSVQRPGGGRTAGPDDYPIGTKRICVDTDYYETFNRDNVTLVDLRGDADRRDHAARAAHRRARNTQFDAIVFATGFDAMTGALLEIDIRGRDGAALREKWEAGPRTYLGLMVAGLPEYVHDHRAGQPVGAEQHDRVDRAACGLDRRLPGVSARARPRRIEATPEARGRMGRSMSTRWRTRTLYPQANSWYMGANIPGKPRVFMPYIGGVGAIGKLAMR